MKTAFIDTSYLIALVSAEDEFHTKAVEVERSFRGELLTTEYVLLELLDAMTNGHQREIAATLIASIRSDPAATVFPASTELFNHGLQLFIQRTDKQWGITDCISFVVMKERGLTEALSADHHFQQAGFKALLRS